MKKILLFFAAVAIMTACSSPKYTYNFDYYNYNSGKKQALATAESTPNDGPEAIQPEVLVASMRNDVTEVEMVTPRVEANSVAKKKTYAQMTQTERKELRSYLKSEVKNSIKAKKASIQSVSSTKGMDNDLKLASVFGAVGIVGILLGSVSQVFLIIGGIALLIGVIFFVMWLLKQ